MFVLKPKSGAVAAGVACLAAASWAVGGAARAGTGAAPAPLDPITVVPALAAPSGPSDIPSAAERRMLPTIDASARAVTTESGRGWVVARGDRICFAAPDAGGAGMGSSCDPVSTVAQRGIPSLSMTYGSTKIGVSWLLAKGMTVSVEGRDGVRRQLRDDGVVARGVVDNPAAFVIKDASGATSRMSVPVPVTDSDVQVKPE